jgi:protease I
MANELSGMRVAFLTANEGVERAELVAPWQAVQEAGGVPELLAPATGKVQTFNHLDKADSIEVVPGGVTNADELRAVQSAVTFTRLIFETGKPAAVICHGPWVLVEADLVRGRTLTSWPSLSRLDGRADHRWRIFPDRSGVRAARRT